MHIDGSTRLVGIIGIRLTTRSRPRSITAAFDYLGLNWCYVPLPVEEGNLSAGVDGIKALRFAEST